MHHATALSEIKKIAGRRRAAWSELEEACFTTGEHHGLQGFIKLVRGVRCSHCEPDPARTVWHCGRSNGRSVHPVGEKAISERGGLGCIADENWENGTDGWRQTKTLILKPVEQILAIRPKPISSVRLPLNNGDGS